MVVGGGGGGLQQNSNNVVFTWRVFWCFGHYNLSLIVDTSKDNKLFNPLTVRFIPFSACNIVTYGVVTDIFCFQYIIIILYQILTKIQISPNKGWFFKINLTGYNRND